MSENMYLVTLLALLFFIFGPRRFKIKALIIFLILLVIFYWPLYQEYKNNKSGLPTGTNPTGTDVIQNDGGFKVPFPNI